jgi:hypothetical protein
VPVSHILQQLDFSFCQSFSHLGEMGADDIVRLGFGGHDFLARLVRRYY